MPEPRQITVAMVHRGERALRGQIAQMGCTCRWDEDGNPPPDCGCGERAAKQRWDLAYKVLDAALRGEISVPTSKEPGRAS